MIEFMKSVARQAGAIALSGQMDLQKKRIHTKANARDLVTDTDRAVEDFICSRIREEYPGYGIFGEETGKSDSSNGYCFIIDPIDGTASFVHNLPNWCISIGLYKDDQPAAAVVYQPSMNNLYYAEKGKGAYLNGTRIHVSTADTLVESIVGTGFYCLREGWKEENNLKFFSRVAPLVADIRKYGSAALDACHVASGSLEAWWELCLAPYDIAAGALILTEAGGTVTDLHGGKEYPHRGILGSNGKIHNTMLEFFQDFKELHR